MKTLPTPNLINIPLQRGGSDRAQHFAAWGHAAYKHEVAVPVGRVPPRGALGVKYAGEAIGNFLSAVCASLKRGVNDKQKRAMFFAFVSAFCILHSASLAHAATTINATNKYAYGANIGWMDWRGDTNSGAIVGEYVCSGYIYAANVGWINLGGGAPTNGIQYQNFSANDFGVNQDGLGNLRGYAYGANIGWINFENNGAPKIDLGNGQMTGYAYSANCGWISLSNASALVQTDAIARGTDSDANGLPDAWELQNFGHLGVNPNADTDGDGMSNLREYLAGTNPNDANDALRITTFQRGNLGQSARVDMVWTSKPTRFYAVQSDTILGSLPFADLIVLPFAGANNVAFFDFHPNSFYRVRAFRPLTP